MRPTHSKFCWVNPCYSLAPPAETGVPVLPQLRVPLPLALSENGLGWGDLEPSCSPCHALGAHQQHQFPADPSLLLWLPRQPSRALPALGSCRTGGSTAHSCFTQPRLPQLLWGTCVLLPGAGTGWEGLSQARLCTQLTSPGARCPARLPAPEGECQPLAPRAPCSLSQHGQGSSVAPILKIF